MTFLPAQVRHDMCPTHTCLACLQDVGAGFRDQYALAKLRSLAMSGSEEVPQAVKDAAAEARTVFNTKIKNSDECLTKPIAVVQVGCLPRVGPAC